MKSKITIFCLSHSEQMLSQIMDRPDLVRVDLTKLDIGEYQRNDISESRAFIANVADASQSEYSGYATARWNQKFPHICNLSDLHFLSDYITPETVFAPAIDEFEDNWLKDSEFAHPGMEALIGDVAYKFDLNIGKKALMSNNFICHRDVMKDFHKSWREMFDYAFKLHGFWPKFQNRYDFYDASRHAGYFYERLTTLYFANRRNLRLERIGPTSLYKHVDSIL